MPTALVTGATGQVGSHIVDRLAEAGWDVRALVRAPSRAEWLQRTEVREVVSDVLDAQGFAAAARGCNVIFHTAAAITPRGGWEAYRRLNIDGTRNAVAAAQSSGARLVHLSSVAVYGSGGRYRPDGRKTDEEAPLPPLPERAFYARSKRESEEIVMRAHAEGRVWATAVRPDVIYGPRDRQFIPRLARVIRHGVAPVIGAGRSTLAVVHAANVADGSVLAAAHDAAGGRSFNLANDYDVTVADFMTLAGVGLGRRVRLLHIPEWAARAAFGATETFDRLVLRGRLGVGIGGSLGFLTRDNPFTSERARRELGWQPRVRPADGVPDAFRWWHSHSC